MLRVLLALLLLAGWAGEACAQTYLVATIGSYHFDRDRDYNERNFGLGLERRVSEDWSVSTGFFKNSFYRDSVYAFAGYTPARLHGWNVGVVGGAASGYDDGLSPWLTGIATRDFGRLGINLVFSGAGVALQVKFSLDGR